MQVRYLVFEYRGRDDAERATDQKCYGAMDLVVSNSLASVDMQSVSNKEQREIHIAPLLEVIDHRHRMVLPPGAQESGGSRDRCPSCFGTNLDPENSATARIGVSNWVHHRSLGWRMRILSVGMLYVPTHGAV